jgi:hypothetical protein
MKMMGTLPALFLAASAAFVVTVTNTSMLSPDQLGRDVGKAFEIAILVAVFDDDVLSLDVAQFAQSLPEGLQPRRVGGRRNGRQITYARDLLCLLGGGNDPARATEHKERA